MAMLYLGLALFFIPHLAGMFGYGAGLKSRIGAGAYKGVYSLLALAGLVVIVLGYQQAPFEPIYDPLGSAALPHALMPLAVIFAAGANMKSNLKQFIRHPMAMATLIWAGTHLTQRGDLAAVALFGSFALFAVLNMVLSEAGPRPPAQPRKKDVILVVAGLVAYGAIGWLHGALGGVPVFG